MFHAHRLVTWYAFAFDKRILVGGCYGIRVVMMLMMMVVMVAECPLLHVKHRYTTPQCSAAPMHMQRSVGTCEQQHMVHTKC